MRGPALMGGHDCRSPTGGTGKTTEEIGADWAAQVQVRWAVAQYDAGKKKEGTGVGSQGKKRKNEINKKKKERKKKERK